MPKHKERGQHMTHVYRKYLGSPQVEGQCERANVSLKRKISIELSVGSIAAMIRFSPHFPFHHHMTRLLTHCPNCSWLTVQYTTWMPDAHHLPRTSMPYLYLTLMTQTQCLYLPISASALGTSPTLSHWLLP